MENKLFPGRAGYTGPTHGWFGLLHHDQLLEKSHDVLERVDYIRREKPEHERAIRLHNLIYLGEVGDAFAIAREAARSAAGAARENFEDAMRAAYSSVLAYIRMHIPDCAWNDEQWMLELPKEPE